MPHRATKEQRKAAIDAKTKDSAVPSVIAAGIIAKLMIDSEEMVGLGDKPGHDLQDFDWNADIRREQLEARWARQDAAAGHRTRDGKKRPDPRKKRKVSDYSKQFGIILKALKKKHPRTPITNLMARAHTGTRKVMKKKAPKKLTGRQVIRKSGQFRRDKILPRRK